jgi:hypothetical protein
MLIESNNRTAPGCLSPFIPTFNSKIYFQQIKNINPKPNDNISLCKKQIDTKDIKNNLKVLEPYVVDDGKAKKRTSKILQHCGYFD